MLLMRCANGAVGWRIVYRAAGQPTIAFCLNDGLQVPIPQSPLADYITAVRSLFAHAVTLQGALIETVDIPSLDA